MNQELFYWINQDGGNHYDWLDSFMLFLSNPLAAIIPVGALAAYVLTKDKSRWRILVGLVIVIGLDDWLGGILKNALGAIRPCEALESVRILIGCGVNSFPSNHAANTAVFAVYVSLFYRKIALWVWLVPFLVGLSRIYVGAHYPVDVIGGWIFGSVIAVIGYLLHVRYIYPPDLRHLKFKN